MITEKEINALGDKHANIAEFLRHILSSPSLNTYLSIRLQVDTWNSEIQENPEGVSDSKDEKRFERIMMYIKESRRIADDLEYIRSKLLPSDIANAEVKYASLADEARAKSNNSKKADNGKDESSKT